MSKPSARKFVLGVGGLVLALMVGSPAPAHAVNPYKPSGGTLAFVADAPVKFTISPSLTTLTCTTFSFAGAVENSGIARAHSTRAGYFNSFTFSGCSNPQLGAATVTSSTTWNFMITGDAPVGGGAWPAQVTNVLLHVSFDWATCDYDLRGAISGTYNPSTRKFTVSSSTLQVENTTGIDCATLDVLDGDPTEVDGRWTDKSLFPLTLSH
ncbi:hypothetical protein [Pimelobacter simplex]|uniref:hypothetical protein n=1 Tax=Nocardioides simplex TaxID=2045 RepID=UPI003AAFDBEE